MFRVIYIVFLFIFLLGCSRSSRISPPKAKNGQIQISSWDFQKYGTIYLNGEWDFYWHKLVKPEEINRLYKLRKNQILPASWVKYGFPSHGFATYQLKLDILPKKRYGLRIIDFSSSYKIWLDNHLFVETGRVAMTEAEYQPSYQSKIFYFDAHKSEHILTIQVANYSHTKGGMWNEIEFGLFSQIQLSRETRLIQDIFLFGVFLIMGFYHFALYLYRKKDKSPLFFGIFCLILSIRILITGEKYLYTFFPGFDWYLGLKIEYLTVFFALPSFMIFTHTLYPDDFYKFPVWFVSIISSLYILITIFASTTFLSKILLLFQFLIVCISIYYLYFAIRILFMKKQNSIIIISGVIPILYVTINDILYASRTIYTGFYLPVGFFLFIITQAIALSIRFSKAFATVESMSEQLKKLDKLKDEFLANTSHELRTPLNGIIGIADSLIDGASGDLSDQTKKNLFMISSSGKRLSSLVNDILDFSKIKNNEIQFDIKNLDLYRLTENVLTLSYPLIANKPIQLINKIKPKEHIVNGDKNRILQVLHNLIGNSCKFTNKGIIQVDAEKKGNMIIVSISDTGIGIAKEKLEDIFKSFEQIDSAINRKYSGTGLGLSITKKLIEGHGGSIWVESQLNNGSKFYFSLPESKYKEDSIRSQDELLTVKSQKQLVLSAIEKQIPKGRVLGKILAIDDEFINLQVILNHLTKYGFLVETASNATEAFKWLENNDCPDIILLDVMMPGLSGYDVCKILRKDYPIHKLPIVLLTARSQMPDIAAGFEAGANDYLTKPFHTKELLVRVKNLVSVKKGIENSNRLLTLEKELEIAAKIQNSILPIQTPELKNLKISTQYIPMDSIGGDLYDFLAFSRTEIGILIADVSGHGISASIIAGMVKLSFRVERLHIHSPAKLLSNMNKNLFEQIGKGFVTAAYLYINLDEGIVKYATAGHPPILYFKGEFGEYLATKGKVLGAFRNCSIEEQSMALTDNSIFYLYTDGVVETRNKQKVFYGQDRLYEVVKKNIDKNGESILNTIKGDMISFRSVESKISFEDDITGILIKYNKKENL